MKKIHTSTSTFNFTKPQSGFITGMGSFSTGGTTVAELWQSALEGRVVTELMTVKEISGRELQLPVYRAGTPSFSKKDSHLVRRSDRSAVLLLAAAREAAAQAQFSSRPLAPERTGIVIGTSRGPIGLQEKTQFCTKKKPSDAVYSTCSSIAGILSTAFLTEGPAFSVSSTCTSGATALSVALQLIQSGTLDRVIVGGVDAPLVDSLLHQYFAAGILSQDQNLALRPFDLHRSGTVLGEGAAVLILESEQIALQRNAPILGIVKSVVLQSHPQQRASLDPEGSSLQQVLQRSLQHSQLLPTDVELLHLHGTGTERNDRIEAHAVASFFGKSQPLAWASKAITGHPLGAAPLFQVILALEALRHSWVPPIKHCDQLDPACSLRISKGSSIMSKIGSSNALCLNAGFWGNVSSIVLSSLS